MGRPRKSVNYEELLQKINADIEKHTIILKKLKKQKKEIENCIREKSVEDVLNIINDSGKSIDEIKTILEKETKTDLRKRK